MRLFTCALLFLVVAAAGCSRHEVALDEVEGPFTWGGVSNVTHVRHLWFSGQPDEAALEEAKKSGVSVVINLRDPSELDWDEAAAVEALGMRYYNVPVPGGKPFERAAFERIHELVMENHDTQVLVHCSSSNRAGAWLAAHVVEDHGQSFDEALAIGRRAGITKDAIIENLRHYLATPDS